MVPRYTRSIFKRPCTSPPSQGKVPSEDSLVARLIQSTNRETGKGLYYYQIAAQARCERMSRFCVPRGTLENSCVSTTCAPADPNHVLGRVRDIGKRPVLCHPLPEPSPKGASYWGVCVSFHQSPCGLPIDACPTAPSMMLPTGLSFGCAGRGQVDGRD